MKNPHVPASAGGSRLVLVVDDEPDNLRLAAAILEPAGHRLAICTSGSQLLKQAPMLKPDLILLDLSLPDAHGRELLPRIQALLPQTPVIIVTVEDQPDMIVACMRLGCYDYLVKPILPIRLLTTVARALESSAQREEISALQEDLRHPGLQRPEFFAAIVTRSPLLLGQLRYAEILAPTGVPVLITGESGTGKELLAEAIHRCSGRRGEFIRVNIAGCDDQFFSDTLFGHARGAFTGAIATRKGLLDKAAGGTILLDEIGDLSLSSQVKLLRLVQEAEYYPLGSDRTEKSSARVLASTHQDLAALVAMGGFRRDLFFRLGAHHIQLPALRENSEDLPLLLEHFLELHARTFSRKKISAPPELLNLLKSYAFPGNVRELEGLTRDAMLCHDKGVLSLKVFEKWIYERRRSPAVSLAGEENENPDLQASCQNSSEPLPTLKEASQILITAALKRSGGNIQQAANMLGLTRQALSQRLSRTS